MERLIGRHFGPIVVWAACLAAVTATAAGEPASEDAKLPEGVQVVWDISKAYRQTTPTRERICINGLWRWQPASNAADKVPVDGWGYFKVPGSWPGITDYIQKDSQTVHAHPTWKDVNLRSVTAAWYQREISVPAAWAGRRIAVSAEYLNSYAVVYVDGVRVGEGPRPAGTQIRFPAGEVDLTSACHPGDTHELSLLVLAMPLKGVMLSYADTAAAREAKGSVARRGLCGDIYLVSTPAGPRIVDVRADTSVRRKEFTFDAALEGLTANAQYTFRVQITKDDRSIKEFTTPAFRGSDLTCQTSLKEGRIRSTEEWMPDMLWDIHTPKNMYELHLSLLDAGGKVLDVLPALRFGFREFWIDGRDFYLNGSRIFFSAVPKALFCEILYRIRQLLVMP